LTEYRYGFQGQEEDGETNYVNYKFRMHDTRIGRFFAVDPLSPEYPFLSPYAFSENRLVDSKELEGLERINATEYAAESGDCFECLDKKLGYDIGTMQSNNPGIDPKNIQIGQTLSTPFTYPFKTSSNNTNGYNLQSNNNSIINVSSNTHKNKFRVEAMELLNLAGNTIGEFAIKSDKNAETGFWNTTVTTGVTYSLGVSPSAGVVTALSGDIEIHKSIHAKSLVDWANKSGLVSTSTYSFVLNYSKFTGNDPQNNDKIWTATGFGYGGSMGYSGSKSLNTYKVGNFHYVNGHRTLLGLSNKDSVIRAAFDNWLLGRKEFLNRRGISDDSLKKVRESYNKFYETY